MNTSDPAFTGILVRSDGKLELVDSGAVLMLDRKKGLLVCNLDPQDRFCDHIRMIVEKDADAMLLGPLDSEWSGISIEVPVAPSWGQWTKVRLGEFHQGTSAYPVELHVANDPVRYEFLGFLTRGEGRAIIRGMIYNWFQATVNPSLLRCESTSHKFKEESTWLAHTGPKAQAIDRFAEHWSVWKNRFCLSCEKKINDLTGLVPDPGGKNWK